VQLTKNSSFHSRVCHSFLRQENTFLSALNCRWKFPIFHLGFLEFLSLGGGHKMPPLLNSEITKAMITKLQRDMVHPKMFPLRSATWPDDITWRGIYVMIWKRRQSCITRTLGNLVPWLSENRSALLFTSNWLELLLGIQPVRLASFDSTGKGTIQNLYWKADFHIWVATKRIWTTQAF